MSREARHNLWHAFALSVVAFGLHLAWENIQCPIFFEHGSYDASPGGIALATVGDVGITWSCTRRAPSSPGGGDRRRKAARGGSG